MVTTVLARGDARDLSPVREAEIRSMPCSDVTWVLTTGEAGMRSQALGLAEAVGLPVEEKRIAVRAPYAWLPGGLLPMPLAALDPSGDPLAPPWPRLVV